MRTERSAVKRLTPYGQWRREYDIAEAITDMRDVLWLGGPGGLPYLTGLLMMFNYDGRFSQKRLFFSQLFDRKKWKS